MRISPLDIRKQSFKKCMRGVEAEEVRIFLELVASEYEKVLQENAMMAERLNYQDDRLAEYRELEKSMRNSLVTADRIASESRDSSEREAQRIVQDAHLRSERILEDARERLQVLVGEIESLKARKEIYARRFWALVESQIGVLQEHMQDTGEIELLRHRVEQLVAEQASPAPEPEERAAGRPVPERVQERRAATERAATERTPDDEPSFRDPRIDSEDDGHAYGKGRPGEPGMPDRRLPDRRLPDSRLADSRLADGRGLPETEDPDRAPDRGNARRGAAVRAGRPDPEEIPPRKGLQRGLSRLLRGRSQPAPEPAPAPAPPRTAEEAEQEDLGFFPLLGRREGLFQISATEGKDGDTGNGSGDR